MYKRQSKYTGYPPYDDAPKEGEFDWEGFTRNLAIGLGVVAVCAIGAATVSYTHLEMEMRRRE